MERPRLTESVEPNPPGDVDARLRPRRLRQVDAGHGLGGDRCGRRARARRGCRSTNATTIPVCSGPTWSPRSEPLEPDLGDGALALLQSGQPMDAVLATLLNDLNSIPGDIVVVLDDYHVIEAPDVRDGMVFLVDHLPAHVPPRDHQSGRSRSAAGAPAGPGRAGRDPGRRSALHGRRGRRVPQRDHGAGADAKDDVAALEGRTEGWIAALQLAALSMQGREDVAAFIAGFAGDDRYVVDYLVGEVLERQSEPVRNFLLRTSILDPAQRLAGRCRDRPPGRSGHVGDPRPGEPVRDPARRPPALVPLPPPLRRGPAGAARRRAARARRGAPSARRGLVRAPRRPVRGDRPRPRGPGLRAGRRAHRAGGAGDAPDCARSSSCGPGWRRCPPRSSRSGRCSASSPPERSWPPVSSTASTCAWLTPSGWLDAHPDGVGEGPSAGVVVDEENLRLLPISIAMFRAGQARLRGDLARDADPRAACARTRRRRRPPRAGRRGVPAGPGVLVERGARRGAPLVRRGHGHPGAGRAPRRCDRRHQHAGRHPHRPGSPLRRHGRLRASSPHRCRSGPADRSRRGRHARGHQRGAAGTQRVRRAPGSTSR